MAWREAWAGVASAAVLTGFVLLPPGPVPIADVGLVGPASVTSVLEQPSTHSGEFEVAVTDGSDLTLAESVDAGETQPVAFDWTVTPSDLSSEILFGDLSTEDWLGVDWSPSSGSGLVDGADLPATLRDAYERAAAAMPASCRLSPALLAAIGQVESGNLSGRIIGADHVVRPPVLGPPLTGGAYANIPDSDGGRLDGSALFDRAVGPMQFIPSTWAGSGRDGDGDAVADPQNVHDAALSAAAYLCAGGRDLGTAEGLRAALWSYNQSVAYAAVVREWYLTYSGTGSTPLNAASRPRTPAPTPSSASPAPSLSGSPTPLGTPGPSVSPSGSGAAAVTGSPTPSRSSSPSVSFSVRPTPTGTAGASTPTSSSTSAPASPTPSSTFSSPAGTPSCTPGPSRSATPSPSATSSPTVSPTSTPTVSPTSTATSTATSTPSVTGTATPSPSGTSTPTATNTSSATSTPTPTRTASSVPTCEPTLQMPAPMPRPQPAPSLTAPVTTG